MIPNIIFGGSCAIAMVLVCLLPETNNVPLVETIADAEKVYAFRR